MPSPELRVSLTSDGDLAFALPGPNGASRLIPLRWTSSCDPAATLLRVLTSMALGDSEIGTDGAPTSAQVRHWERHEIFRDARCPFCAADAKRVLEAVGTSSEAAPLRFRYSRRQLGGGVEVKRIAIGVKTERAKPAKPATPNFVPTGVKALSAKQLGF